jgi:hypothetical protein
MARRGDLAGLAALGALGYMLSRGDKAAPTGGGGGRMPAAASEAGPSIDDDMRKRALAEGEKVSEGERVSRYKPNPFDVEDAGGGYDRKPAGRPTATTAPSAATGLKNPGTGNQRGPSAEELAAYDASRRTGSGGGRGPRAGEAEAYAASRNVNFSNEGRSRPTAINTGSVKDIPTGGPAGYSGVRGEKIDSSELGRNVSNTLAAMGPGKLSGVSKIGYEMRNADAIRKAAMAGEVPVREAVTNPLAWMAGPKNVGKFSGEVPAAGREAVTNPMAWMSGPKGMKQFEEATPSMTSKAMEAAEKLAARYRKKPLSEADTTGGAIGYKRGGKVKPKKMASGGMARSGASKRADGIATKGKTRGKIC